MIQGAVFLAGRVPALLAQAAGLSLRASLEIGSSFGVKCHHFGTKLELVARTGGFFVDLYSNQILMEVGEKGTGDRCRLRISLF